MTFGDYVTAWLATRVARLAPKSRAAYTSVLRHHVLPVFGASELDAITRLAVRTWLAERLTAGTPRASVKFGQAALSTVLTDAVLDGVLGSNPAHRAGQRLWPATEVRMPKALTQPRLEALLIAADADAVRWFGAYCRIGARSGLRLGELLALRDASLLVDASALRVDCGYQGARRILPPKGGKPRIVEVSPDTLALCLHCLEQSPSEWLFPGRTTAWPASPSIIQRTMVDVVERAGLPAYFTVHALRHTYASMLLAAGAPAQWVQQQLGHASYQLTVDVYGSWLPPKRPDLPLLLEGGDAPVHHPPRPARGQLIRGRLIPFRRPKSA